jgi:glycosyltransferase involved in cell wall biosynthesis
MTRARTGLVIPCYNEEERLDVPAFSSFLQRNPQTCIIFVDDGSEDGTAAQLRRIRDSAGERAVIISLERNVGKAEAVRQGMLRAFQLVEEHAAFWDADLSTPLDVVEDFSMILDRMPDVDAVFGARVQLLGREIRRKRARHYFGRVFATVVSVMLGLPVYDTQCGAKMFRNCPEVISCFEEPFSSRWIFDVELIARLCIAKRRSGAEDLSRMIYEYPLKQWIDVAGSKIRPSYLFQVNIDLLRIYFRSVRPMRHLLAGEGVTEGRGTGPPSDTPGQKP